MKNELLSLLHYFQLFDKINKNKMIELEKKRK